MKIIIIGAGIIGSNLAQSLSEENHVVYLIEQDEETARKIGDKLDAKVIIGSGADPDILKKAEVAEADLVIAVTTSDETNLVVCLLAALLGAKRRIARVRNVSLSKLLDDSGAQHFKINELINPEQVAADAIVKTIQTPGASEVVDFAQGRILLRGFDIPKNSPLCGQRVEELRDEDFPWPFVIVAIIRDGTVLIPKGDAAIAAGDNIYALLPAPSLGEFLTFIDPNIRMPNKAVIFGATEIGERVASSLAKTIGEVILVEEDQLIAEDVAGRLQAVRIIHGSAAAADILTECGIEAADVFIATSGNDHSNLVSAVLAKKMGAKTTIIVNQKSDYMSIMEPLDIDAVINPRLLAADQILRVVRGKSVHSVSQLLEGNTEALEFVPEEGSAITRAPIKEIQFPKNSIIGAVYTKSSVRLAKGDTVIKPGENVIVFCQTQVVKKLQELFTRKTLF